jgi:hypothetical protein
MIAANTLAMPAAILIDVVASFQAACPIILGTQSPAAAEMVVHTLLTTLSGGSTYYVL